MFFRIMLFLFLVAVPAVHADGLETARREIKMQFGLLKQGKANQLRTHFTDRLKDRVTAQAVKKAQKEAAGYSLEELVASATEGEYNGQKTIKIKMKNGRTLTTLVEIDGKWYADTIWFQ